MSEKYILQFGSLAGWPYKIAKELRSRNINSKNVVYYNKDVADLNRNLPFDESIYKPNDGKLTIFKKIIKFIKKSSNDTKLIHYHGSNIFFRELYSLYEGSLFSKNGIPMIMTFGGGDIRPIRYTNQRNPYFYLGKNSTVGILRDIRTKIRLKSWSKYLNYAVVDPELYSYMKPYFKKVYIFRQPIGLDEIECKIPNIDNDVPIILHIPTEPWVKGTDLIIEACDRLKNEGYKFEFKLKRQLTQQELYKEMVNCDIYVDELKCGAHGVTAVEAMCAGKPTLTYIRDDLVKEYPQDLPLVNTNPDTIYENLKILIVDSRLRNEIGKASREYVEKYHDTRVVVDGLIDIYKEILAHKW
jgi:glycosyltransferase involved in cell wall biosynthesis